MKIAIDITPLKTDHQYRGIGSYTSHLIRSLEKYNSKNQYTKFTRGKKFPKNIDLIHYSCFDCFKWTLPLFKKLPSVVTIHDLIPIIFPDKFPRGIKGEIQWQLQRFSLKSVSAIIADSECSKKDVIKFIGFPKERIHVIPLAAGEEFQQLAINNQQLAIKQKYCLPDIFVLYVGDINWNKNIAGLIKAFANVKCQMASQERSSLREANVKSKFQNLKLVLVGKAFRDKGLTEVQEINRLIDELEIADSVLKLGFVLARDLVTIYNLATVYCQPSFYEGFGLPCLEAMVCGTPVVAADIPVLREVCGKASLYVDPGDANDIAIGILEILEFDDSNYQAQVERGLKQAKKFSWKQVAQKTVKVYRKAIV